MKLFILIIILLTLYTPSLCQSNAPNCYNPIQNYDLLDIIEFPDEPFLSDYSSDTCNVVFNNPTCCTNDNIDLITNVYIMVKNRIEVYCEDIMINYKNLLNPFLDFDSLGIKNNEDTNTLKDEVNKEILRFRVDMQNLNKQLVICFEATLAMFAGNLCMTCSNNWQQNIKFIQNTSTIQDYRVLLSSGDCTTLSQKCQSYFDLAGSLKFTVNKALANLVDIFTATIGEVPSERINSLNPSFVNISSDSALFTRRFLYDTPYSNSRVLARGGGRGGSRGGRSSSSSSSSSRSSSSGSSSRSSSSSSSSTSGSSGGRSSSSSSYSSSSRGSLSTSSSSGGYRARTSSAGSQVTKSYTARTSWSSSTRTTSVKVYKPTYVYRRSSSSIYVNSFFYSSFYGTRYRYYYSNQRYRYQKTYTYTNGTNPYITGLSPFSNAAAGAYDQNSLTSYDNLFQNYLRAGSILIETCPNGAKKCKTCIDGDCKYYTKYIKDNYERYCEPDTSSNKICNVCINEVCDVETYFSPSDSGFDMAVRDNKYNTRTNYKSQEKWKLISDQDRVAKFLNDSTFSPKTRRFLPEDFVFPSISIPDYDQICGGKNCAEWICENMFEGIAPSATFLSNPHVNPKSSIVEFTNTSVNQKVGIEFSNVATFSAYSTGQLSSLSLDSMIDDITRDSDPTVVQDTYFTSSNESQYLHLLFLNFALIMLIFVFYL